MQLEHVTYRGPDIDDPDMLRVLPSELVDLLREINGFIQFHGGLHFRGACLSPWWHSLRSAWRGQEAFHVLYPEILESDVPFAEDCLGDQYLLRQNSVIRLSAETGEIELLNLTLGAFLESVQQDPVQALNLNPLLQFQQEGGGLAPGQSLAEYPPFCTQESANGVHLAAVPTEERRRFLAHLANTLRHVPEGGKVKVEVGE